MFDNKNDYALNKKDRDSIVYNGSDGGTIRITKEDFSSEEEFLLWKSWSDADYRKTDYADAYYYRHITEYSTIADSAEIIPSPEEMQIYRSERKEQMREAKVMVRSITESLTPVQFRRLWLHHVNKENVRSIALKEGVAHSCVVASIASAKKKIFKIAAKKHDQNQAKSDDK